MAGFSRPALSKPLRFMRRPRRPPGRAGWGYPVELEPAGTTHLGDFYSKKFSMQDTPRLKRQLAVPHIARWAADDIRMLRICAASRRWL